MVWARGLSLIGLIRCDGVGVCSGPIALPVVYTAYCEEMI